MADLRQFKRHFIIIIRVLNALLGHTGDSVVANTLPLQEVLAATVPWQQEADLLQYCKQSQAWRILEEESLVRQQMGSPSGLHV